jgi:hypothetical protein
MAKRFFVQALLGIGCLFAVRRRGCVYSFTEPHNKGREDLEEWRTSNVFDFEPFLSLLLEWWVVGVGSIQLETSTSWSIGLLLCGEGAG